MTPLGASNPENLHFTGTFLWSEHPSVEGEYTGQATTVSCESQWVHGDLYIHDGIVSRTAKPALTYRKVSGYAIPGLVDVHCHVGVTHAGSVPVETQREQAELALSKGTLLIRDCGVPSDTRWIDQVAELPKIIRCGQHLVRPKRYMRYYGLELENEADLPAAVAQQAQRSDGWVKIVGDWIDRSDGAESDLQPLWSTAVLRDAVAAAHEFGARVTVHTFAHRTIEGLLDAGVDGIEHGTGMDSDEILEAQRRGIRVTPTMLQIARFSDFAAQAGTKYPVYAATMTALDQSRVAHQAALYEAGVQLLPGTDAGGYQRHDALPQELRQWLDLGVSAPEIIDLATWRARDFLGAPSLWEGAPADLVWYDSDPRADLNVLEQPAGVVLRGAIVAGAVREAAHRA